MISKQVVSHDDVMDIIESEFNFTVTKLPLVGPDNLPTPCKGLFRSDTGAFVGRSSVGADYVTHSNLQICELTKAGMSLFGDKVELSCHFRDGHFVSIRPTEEERHASYGTRDNIFPVLMLHAGYDQTPVTYKLFAKRDACDNMILLRTVLDAQYRILHRKSLDYKVEQLLADLSGLKQGWEGVKQAADRMQSREVLLDEFLVAVYGEPSVNEETGGRSSRSCTIHYNRTREIMDRVINERYRTGRPSFVMGTEFTVSAWEAYNAVQGFQQHDATRRKSGKARVTEFDRVILASNDNYVKQAEVLALAS